MNQPVIHISDAARKLCPNLHIEAMCVAGYNQAVNAEPSDTFAAWVNTVDFEQPDNLEQVKVWRDTFQKMGLKPSKYLSSIEALYKRAAKQDGGWQTGLPFVDCYNATSIMNLVTFGAHDIDTLPDGDIVLRPIDRDSDRFTALGGNIDLSLGNDNLLVYAIGNNVLGWAINHRDSSQYCLRDSSEDVLLISESITPEGKQHADKAMAQLASFFTSHGVSISYFNP